MGEGADAWRDGVGGENVFEHEMTADVRTCNEWPATAGACNQRAILAATFAVKTVAARALIERPSCVLSCHPSGHSS
jgi:hypothetical protein